MGFKSSNLFPRHFPDSRSKWKKYSRIAIPAILGAVLFSLSGLVDNLMVGRYNAAAGLSIAISIGVTYLGFLAGISSAGSILMAQFYHNKQINVVTQVSRIRFFVSLSSAIIFIILIYSIPYQLISIFLYPPQINSFENILEYQAAYDQYLVYRDFAHSYMEIIAISWVLISITLNYSNQLKELGHARVTMYWSIATLVTNIALNSILIFGFDLGVQGAAWASVAARIVALVWGTTYIHKHDLPIGINILKILKIERRIWKEYFKRWYLIFSLGTLFFFLTFRYSFFEQAFPTGIIARGVGSASVVGLTYAVFDILSQVYSALGALAANFVGSELGKNNLKQAKINADELKGFTLVLVMFFVLVLLIISSTVPYYTFLVNEGDANVDTEALLVSVQQNLFVLTFIYPFVTWFVSSYNTAISGGKSKTMIISDWIMSGPLQLSWAAILMLVIVPRSNVLQSSFGLSYLIFYLSDFVRLFVIEVIYYRYKWLHSITHEKTYLKSDEVKI